VDVRPNSAQDPAGPTKGTPDSVSQPSADRHGLATFLFADIRGYTWFTAHRGAEAAAELVDRFAALADRVVQEHHGAVRDRRPQPRFVPTSPR
jgi:class 3 adenylate cyclase